MNDLVSADITRMTPQLNITDPGALEEEKKAEESKVPENKEVDGIDFYPDRTGFNSSMLQFAPEDQPPAEEKETME